MAPDAESPQSDQAGQATEADQGASQAESLVVRQHQADPAPAVATNGLRLTDSVKVITEGHPRHEQAGSVRRLDENPETVGVLFDADANDDTMGDHIETVDVADLERL